MRHQPGVFDNTGNCTNNKEHGSARDCVPVALIGSSCANKDSRLANNNTAPISMSPATYFAVVMVPALLILIHSAPYICKMVLKHPIITRPSTTRAITNGTSYYDTSDSRFGHACNTHYRPHTPDCRLGHDAGTSPQNLSTIVVFVRNSYHS